MNLKLIADQDYKLIKQAAAKKHPWRFPLPALGTAAISAAFNSYFVHVIYFSRTDSFVPVVGMIFWLPAFLVSLAYMRGINKEINSQRKIFISDRVIHNSRQ